MSDRTSTAQNGPDPRAQALVGSYTRAGYVRIDPPVLQPAAPFLDLSGEDIRRRMFLTTDPKGREMCLRPDLTIPVSRAYLQSTAAGKPAGFCYIGPVFRHRQSASAESLQVGIESFGRQDKAAADAEMLALGLEATAQFRVSSAEIRTGDVGLFSAFVAALDLAPAWKRRLVKDFNRKSSLKHDLNQLTLAAAENRAEYQGVLAALAGSDPKAAHHLVTDLLSIAGIATVGGRTVAEIADRFLEQATLNATTPRPNCGVCARTQEFRSARRSLCSRRGPASSPLAVSRSAPSNSQPLSAAASTITPASYSNCTDRAAAIHWWL